MPLRSYDPTIARWNRIDPVTHHSLSTYNGFDNNPIYYADPSGGNSFRGGHANRLQRMRDNYFGSEYSNLDSFVARAHDFSMLNNDSNSGSNYGTDLTGALAQFGYRKRKEKWEAIVEDTDQEFGEEFKGNCCGFFGTIPPVSFLGIRIAFFKSFFPKDETANNFIDHYIYGGGEEFTLNQKQMLEIYPTTVDVNLTMLDFLSVGDLSPGESVDFTDYVEVYAGSSGTLGHFTVTRTGKITLNAKTGKREFSGNFIFNDTYDFNAGNHRPWDAELQVTLARNFLPGRPFQVSGRLSVHQIQGQIITTQVNGYNLSPLFYKKPKDTQERRATSKF